MLKLRSATPADVPLMLEYIRELAEYERAPEKVVARAEDLERYVPRVLRGDGRRRAPRVAHVPRGGRRPAAPHRGRRVRRAL